MPPPSEALSVILLWQPLQGFLARAWGYELSGDGPRPPPSPGREDLQRLLTDDMLQGAPREQVIVKDTALGLWQAENIAQGYEMHAKRDGTWLYQKLEMLVLRGRQKLLYDSVTEIDAETEAADERGGHARVSGCTYEPRVDLLKFTPLQIASVVDRLVNAPNVNVETRQADRGLQQTFNEYHLSDAESLAKRRWKAALKGKPPLTSLEEMDKLVLTVGNIWSARTKLDSFIRHRIIDLNKDR